MTVDSGAIRRRLGALLGVLAASGVLALAASGEAQAADSSSCSRKYCDCEKCFYQRARGRLRAANVIIVNHALLFALTIFTTTSVSPLMMPARIYQTWPPPAALP